MAQTKEIELIKKYQKGDDKALISLIDLHTEYLGKIAHSYHVPSEIEDLISEGIVGIMTAAKSFDTSSNYKFLTYATPKIRSCMDEYMKSIGVVHVTDWGKRKMLKSKELDRLQAFGKKVDLDPDEMKQVIDHLLSVQDESYERLMDRELKEAVEKAIEKIENITERNVVKRYLGVGCDAMIAKDIADALSISRSIVSRYIKSGLEKLREDETLIDYASPLYV